MKHRHRRRETGHPFAIVLAADSLKRGLQESAWRRGMGVSELVRIILEAFVAADSEANSEAGK